MTWLVTGGSGQLGVALTQELLTQGLKFQSWNSRDLDISNEITTKHLISNLSPTVIVNCAAWTDVDGAEVDEKLAFNTNAKGAENVALAAKECGARLIQISTDYVFSGEVKEEFQIQDEQAPVNAYGRTKAEGEKRVLLAYPENAAIIRTAWLYSKWGKNFAKSMTRLALHEEEKIKVVNDQIGQPTLATDLAGLLVEFGQSEITSGIFHGTNSGACTWYEFAQEIFRLAGADVKRILPISSKEYASPAKRPTKSILSHDTWSKTSLEPMRNWKIALSQAMPEIIQKVSQKGDPNEDN